MNAQRADTAGSRSGPPGGGEGRWIMAPTSLVELPDVLTTGCDEGVEFVFLEGDGDTKEETRNDDGGRIAGQGEGMLR